MNRLKIISDFIDQDLSIRVTAIGNSMYPTFMNPSVLIVKKCDFNLGYISIVYTDTHLFLLHRIIKIDDKKGIQLKGDGIGVEEREWLKKNQVIGIVVGFVNEKYTIYYKLNSIMCRYLLRMIAVLSKTDAFVVRKLRNIKSKRLCVIFVKLFKLLYYFLIRIINMLIYKFYTERSECQ
jgi:signal peptidase I